MREEVERIIKLVKDGKLSPEDAADLIDAFHAADNQAKEADEPQAAATGAGTPPPPPPPPGAGSAKDPFRAFVETMEKFGKDASESVKWDEVAQQVREGTRKGVEVLRSGLEEVAKGRISFTNLFSLQESKEVSLPLAVPAGKVLRVENLAGNVKIVGGFDVGTVTAHARFRGLTVEEARAKAAEYTLILEESDHQVLVRQPDVSGLSVEIEIQMAGTGPVEVRCDSGDVSVLDTKGGARIQTRAGDIHLRGLEGLIEINADSGDVSVEDSTVTGLTLEGKAGDVTLKNVRGNVNVRAASGDVTARECSGKVFSVEAVSGDLLIDLSEPITGNIDLRTVSGDANVSIVDGSDCRVSVSTLRGSASCEIELEDRAASEQRVTGRLGSGNGVLNVSAVSGDIHLKLRDQVSSA